MGRWGAMGRAAMEGCRRHHGAAASVRFAAVHEKKGGRRRGEEKKRKEKKREKKEKNMENFSNLKIFGEKSKRLFMKLVKIIF
jgi:hypothetical protein